MEYTEFLKLKIRAFEASGFEVDENILNPMLKPFQKWCVRTALKKGRYAFFEDCGLGKTCQQLEWAKHVLIQTGKSVLILAPLAVSAQTIQEGIKFGIPVYRFNDVPYNERHFIVIANYEQLDNIDCSVFGGVVLDESSILKNYEGSIRNQLIEYFKDTPYKLCCTATPSPNDPMELGNHSEFLNIMGRNEMLSMHFVHDGGETAKWRLKGHSVDRFWQWVSTWAVMLSKPADIGFSNEGYELPPLNYIEHTITTPKRNNGQLFNDAEISATNHNRALRDTMFERMTKVSEIVSKNTNEDWIIWVKLNDEEKLLKQLIPNSVVVTGSDTNQQKEDAILWFTKEKCLCHTHQKKRKNTASNGKLKTRIGEQNNQQKGSEIDEKQTHNGTKNEKNIIDNTTQLIKTKQKSIEKKIQTTEIYKEESTTNQITITEKNAKNLHWSIEKITPNSTLETHSKQITVSPSKIIDSYFRNRTINAPSAKEIQPSLQANKDYTLTTAIPQGKLGDYCVSTAIRQSESSMITSNCYDEQYCTCKANSTGKIIISKTSILGFGVNAQNCHNQIFASLDFSFEGLYQSIRRSYRFGQTKEVNIHIITTDTMRNVIASIQHKQKQFEEMQNQMQRNMNECFSYEVSKAFDIKDRVVKSESFTLMRGDCVEKIKSIESESVGFSIFSPPFAELYTYSDALEDMGNSTDYKQFLIAFKFLVEELFRVMYSGRNVAVHCMDLPIQKGKEGYIGLRDFSNMIRETFEKSGFIYHSRVTIWKDPVIEMQRTKALGLLHKQVKKDAAMSRVGLPDYLLVFRKPGEHQHPVTCNIPVDLWQKYASPVWYDINYSNTLNLKGARDEKDEKHICPLQLETIERAIHLWSNEGDTVFTPFLGIGSEVFKAVQMKRYGIGIELKQSYFNVAVKNCKEAEYQKDVPKLF
jgi:DNA modification methylase